MAILLQSPSQRQVGGGSSLRGKFVIRLGFAVLILIYFMTHYRLQQLHHSHKWIVATTKRSASSFLTEFYQSRSYQSYMLSQNASTIITESSNGFPGSVGIAQIETPNTRNNSKILQREKLQIKLDRIYQSTGKQYDGNLWDLSDYVPKWMKEYFNWHSKVRKQWEINVNSKRLKKVYVEDIQEKLVVIQCIKDQDLKCGGTADRLKHFVYFLREAREMKRMLLIHWKDMPARIEEYLLPPIGGIDWRVPDWMLDTIIYNSTVGRKLNGGVDKFDQIRKNAAGARLIRIRMQSISGFAEFYDPMRLSREEPTFAEVYHDVWRIFFTPSLPVRQYIEQEIQGWDPPFEPGQFAAAHLRALYGRRPHRHDDDATDLTQNALNCASNLRPGGPFFFASDHTFSTFAAVKYGKERSNTVVYIRKHESQPLHIEKAENAQDRYPHEFYDTYVDLLLMGMSRCLVYNRGGFGQWASMIGYDSNCTFNQKTSAVGIANRCNWTDPPSKTDAAEFADQHNKKRGKVPLFLEPMR